MNLFRVDEFDEEFISEKLLEMYERAEEWLWFSSSLHPDFFNRTEIQETITNLAENGVSIRILLNEEVDVERRRDQVGWIFDQRGIQIRQSDEDISHRVITDRNDLRLEKDHDISQKGAANLIAMDAVADLHQPYKDEFEGWWNSAQSV